MSNKWSPHPRYRLYTTSASYAAPWSGKNGLIRAFEDEVARRFNVAGAVCVPMARVGLFLTIREMIRPGQKVILSPLTIVDVVNAVLLAGGIPVFADIERRSCGMDPDQAESLIDHQTGALLLTHLHGETAGAPVFREICARRGIRLLEDAAQAFGAIEDGLRAGTIGDAGVYSFGFYKNLTTWRGAMVVSNDTALIGRIREQTTRWPELSKLGLSLQMLRGAVIDVATWPPLFQTLIHPLVRQNIAAIERRLDPESGAIRLNAMPQNYLRSMRQSQAWIGLQQLDDVDSNARCRIEHAYRYHDGLDACQNIILPRRRTDLANVYTYFPIQIANRHGLLRYALDRHRDFAAQHLRNCADLPMFTELRRDCPRARAAARELVLLPTYPRYPEAEIAKNVELIKEWCIEAREGWKNRKGARWRITSVNTTERDNLDKPTTATR